MQKFKSVDELVSQLKPEKPVYCIRKKSIHSASKTFQNKFPGKILYAVKTNPHPEVLKTIVESGIENFDVASIKEIEDIFYAPNAFNPYSSVEANQIFRPTASLMDPVTYHMYIYNRWGELIFETTDYEKGWNGKIYPEKSKKL